MTNNKEELTVEKSVNKAFEFGGVTVKIELLFPTKLIPPSAINGVKYKQTEVSIKKIGIIEPPIVFPKKDHPGNYLLLDGHMRIQILQNMGIEDVFCLISKEDEGYVANKEVNRLATIQEHFMIMRAIERGVSAEEIAATLGVDANKIVSKTKLLDGICPETVDLLKDHQVPFKTFKILRKMKPERQIQAAKYMIVLNNLTETFAKSLLIATNSNMLIEPDKPKKIEGLTSEQIVSLEGELGNLEQEFKVSEDALGNDILRLVIYRGYLKKLLENIEVSAFLSQNQPIYFEEFKKFVESPLTEIPTT